MLEKFFQIGIGLKTVQRKGWKDKLKIENPESVADHSYVMTLMSMILSDLEGFDTKKVMSMSLIHDLAESLVGDFTPDEISRSKKIQLENNAMEKILETLPTNLSGEYRKLWGEYQAKQTRESILVHEIDKLEMAFQAYVYLKKDKSKGAAQFFIDTANKEISNKQLREILSKLLE